MLHELVHTRIHNHSMKFWAELDRYVGNSKAMAKRLIVGCHLKSGEITQNTKLVFQVEFDHIKEVI
ncbi:YgjP-like metallopeptidase domain-containing protein, partial [Chloroflexota bacterium]